MLVGSGAKVKATVVGVFLLLGMGLAPGQIPGGKVQQAEASEKWKQFVGEVSEFILPNGVRFIVLERRQTPVISFHTYVRAGTADVPAGQSGLGKLLENLAWTGTGTIGTRDWPSEKKALEAVEEAYDQLEAERDKGGKADDVKITSLQIEAKLAVSKAQSFAKPEEYFEVLSENGAKGVGATVTADAMQYTCTLPSNRAELWFAMESQRLARPVLRDFYMERDKLADEARGPQTGNAEARLLEVLAAVGFTAHPYRNPANGWPGDLENLRAADARAFLDRYVVPGKVTIAMVGDVTAAGARRLAEKYFAAWPAKFLPPPVHTREPAQTARRTGLAIHPGSALVAIGYQRPSQSDRDDIVLDLIQIILGDGTSGWLVRDLVRDRNAALGVRVQATFPGGRYPGLFAVLVAPAAGRTFAQTEVAVTAELDRLRVQPVDQATLARAKARARQAVLDTLSDNAATAALLATGAAEYGAWRQGLMDADRIETVRAEDVQRVAAKYFVPEHRTVVYSGPAGPVSEARAGGVR